MLIFEEIQFKTTVISLRLNRNSVCEIIINEKNKRITFKVLFTIIMSRFIKHN